MFSKSDLNQFKKRGINIKEINLQLENFKKGIKFVLLQRPASIQDGIKQLNKEEEEYFVELFEKKQYNQNKSGGEKPRR